MQRARGRRSLALLLAVGVVLAGVVPPASAAEDAKLVLVLDSSGSMEERVGADTKIAVAKRALGRVIDRLPGGAAVGLRVYGATVFDRRQKGACTDSQLVVPIGTGNRSALRAEIATYKPYGETPISYALQQAADDLGRSGQRTVVLVSDGEETCDADPCETAEEAAGDGIQLRFDVIGLGVSGRARDQLRCVAERGRGTYYDADNAEEVVGSLDRLATRAFRPFQLTGTPVAGSLEKEQAPVIEPGQYVDVFAVRLTKRHYRIRRTIPGGTLHVSVSAEATGLVPGFHAALWGGDETKLCGSDLSLTSGVAGVRRLVSTAVTSGQPGTSPCTTADELLLTVDPANRSLERRRFELRVHEEPPASDVAALPPPESRVSWRPMRPGPKPLRAPVAGAGLSDAPVLRPGTYSASILCGEKQVYAVDLDWGQRLQVQALVPPRRGALAEALGPSTQLEVQLLGSTRGWYDSVDVVGRPSDTGSMRDDGDTHRVSAGTPTIRYRNRESAHVAGAALPGPQHVVLGLSRLRDQPELLVPYVLVVSVIGTAGDGAPAYLVDPPAPSPSPTPTPAAAPSSPPPTPPAVDPPDGPPPAALVGIGLIAALLGAGGVLAALAWSRRRRRSHDDRAP